MTEKELNSVRELHTRIRDFEWYLKALRESADNIVPILDGMPHATTIQSKVEKLTVKLADAERELTELKSRFVDAAVELESKIHAANLNRQEEAVLILRYVSCMNFQDIWQTLNTSDARIFYLHRTGVKNLLKVTAD